MSNRETTRREFLQQTALGVAGLAVAGQARRAPAQVGRQKPNILFIHVDQQHWEAMSAYGCPYVQTPHMDRLVAGGTSFRSTYAANPVCCPARASWYTGRASCEHGVVINEWPMVDDVPDLGQWLSARGYGCFYTGKWHIPRRKLHESFTVLNYGSGIGESTDRTVSNTAANFLRSYKGDQPFFLNAGFLQPHDCCYWVFEHRDRMGELPYPAIAAELPPLPDNFQYDPREPEGFVKRFRGAPGQNQFRSGWTETQWRYYLWAYYRMVEMADAEVGRILDALEDSGHLNDTLLIFGSDHGDGIARHQMTSKMYHYDEANRVTFVVSQPGVVGQGVDDTQHLISGLDVAPTICDYAGVEPLPKARGKSLRPLLEGQPTEWREFLVSETVIVGRMVRTPEWKLITYRDSETEQLFDLRTDPGETHNLSGETKAAGTQRSLHKLLDEWESHLEPIDLKGRAPKPKPQGKPKG